MSDPISMLEDQLLETHRRYESAEGLLQQLIRENGIMRNGLYDLRDEWPGKRTLIDDILERADKC